MVITQVFANLLLSPLDESRGPTRTNIKKHIARGAARVDDEHGDDKSTEEEQGDQGRDRKERDRTKKAKNATKDSQTKGQGMRNKVPTWASSDEDEGNGGYNDEDHQVRKDMTSPPSTGVDGTSIIPSPALDEAAVAAAPQTKSQKNTASRAAATKKRLETRQVNDIAREAAKAVRSNRAKSTTMAPPPPGSAAQLTVTPPTVATTSEPEPAPAPKKVSRKRPRGVRDDAEARVDTATPVAAPGPKKKAATHKHSHQEGDKGDMGGDAAVEELKHPKHTRQAPKRADAEVSYAKRPRSA
ncbi:hypothetical protein BDN72DRAFT_907060 [Pluteus cervinus]|uniref:Uncharacterized protein n=1 Tax=Pluteus cervinus TaxID=181527 RepID=A0ACD2ZXK1_9AGAR|nr:hypothetical protein BDN72DRAFT_907060 [Pluteus cervinus]